MMEPLDERMKKLLEELYKRIYDLRQFSLEIEGLLEEYDYHSSLDREKDL